MAGILKTDDSSLTAQDLARLRHRINATRDQATRAHAALSKRRMANDVAFAPFLDACANDLEELANLCRSVADQAARPTQI